MSAMETPYKVREDDIRDQVTTLGEIVSNPKFVNILEELEEASAEERPHVLRRIASVDTFREYGIPTPEGLRVAPRVFEKTDAATRTGEYAPYESGDVMQTTAPAPMMGLCASVGFYVCVSYGR